MQLAASVLVVVAVAALGAGGASGQTTSADEPVEAQVDGGFDGHVVPGRPVPVKVTLRADELWSGDVAVSIGAGPAEQLAVEITGGTAEEHWVLLDAPAQTDPNVVVSARSGNRTLTVGRARLGTEPDLQLIGTLAGLGGIEPGELRTAVGDQEIVLVRLEPALLDLGPDALGALDAVAVTPEDLASLSDAHRGALLGWLTLGGTLYVDAPTGTIPDWPDVLQPSEPRVRAGAATVVATDGALARGEWSSVVLPAPNRSVFEDDLVAQTMPFTDWTSEMFGADLGRDLPELTRLLGILALYALAVGPLAHVLLRRRVMARWIVIPGLAVLATVALVAQGGGKGTDAAASVIDIVETGPGSAMASSRILMATDQGGRHVDAPVGWSASADEGAMWGWGMGSGLPVTQRRTLDGVEMAVPAAAGGVGVLSAHGPVAFTGTLEISATATDDGTITGTVRNTTEVALHDVAIFAGRAAHDSLDTIEPGATADFELDGTNRFRFGSDPFSEVWRNAAFGMGGFPDMGVAMECDDNGNCVETIIGGGPTCAGDGCDDVVPRPGNLGAALRPRGVNAMPPGMITAIGWATDLDPVLDLGPNVTVRETRTAVVSRAVAEAGGTRLVDAASVRELVSARMNDTGLLELAYRFDLPSSVDGRPIDPARLRIDVPSIFHNVELLTPSGPVVLREPDPDGMGAPPAREELSVPAEAVVGGQVFIRCTLEPVAPPEGRELVIFEAATT